MSTTDALGPPRTPGVMICVRPARVRSLTGTSFHELRVGEQKPAAHQATTQEQDTSR